MKTYQIKSQIWSCLFVIFIFLPGSAIFLAILVITLNEEKYTITTLFMLLLFSGILIISLSAIKNSLISIFSGLVTIEWDGKTLRVLHRNSILAIVDSARWVYREPHTIIVIATMTKLTRFNRGHVRSNGRELVIGDSYGRGLGDLAEQVVSLGPQKKWLWRRMPF